VSVRSNSIALDAGLVANKRPENIYIMLFTIGVLIYLVFCLLTGFAGSQRRIGFFGTFLISFFITPPVMLLVLILTGPSRRVEWHRRPQND
jgi:hypothetical protein